MTSKSLEDTRAFAGTFLKKLNGREKSAHATVVGLHGDLGSGKTTFTQCVAEALGVTDHIQSPTFVIIKNYQLKTINYKLLIHIDAYRLNSAEEIKKLGWDDMVSNPKNLILIEWPERIGDAMPKDSIKIDFRFIDDKTREIDTNFQ